MILERAHGNTEREDVAGSFSILKERRVRHRARNVARTLVRAVLAAAAYYECARLGYLFAIPHGIVTLWPASGLMLGLLLVSNRRDWPALVVGGVVGSISSDMRSGFHTSFVIAAAFANAIEWLSAASLVRWRLKRRMTLTTLRDVWELAGTAAVLSNAVTALLGGLALSFEFGRALPHTWFVWWIGDGLGMLVVAPVVIGAARASDWRRRSLANWIEIAVGLTILFVVSLVALGAIRPWTVQPGSYATIPLILWAALRFGPGGAATATLVVAGIATWYAALGVGPFASESLSGIASAMHVYAFLGVVSLTGLVLGAVLEERELAARRQRESENRYRAVVEAATDAIVTIDERGRVQFANPAIEAIFGYAPEELIGRELTMLMPSDVAERHKSGLAAYVATGRRTIAWRAVALTGRHRSGALIPLEASFGERIENGRRLFTGILRDVSEQHAAKRALDDAESRMRFAMEASRVGTWEVEFATGAAQWSETHEALHGLPAGTFGGTFEAFLDHIHPEDRATVADEIERATKQHTDSSILYRTVWPDGSVRWLSGVGRTFYDADGAPVRAAGIGLDVTERRSLEEQYRQSQKMDAIGQLAGGVAHDFNNLLTAIQGYGSLLSESLEPGSPEQGDVAEILRAADRAAALTRQLLAFSRKQVLAPRPLALGQSLRTIEPMLRRLIGEHIELVVRPAAGTAQILADPGQVEQVVLNLCLNARDAMPDGGLLLVEETNVVLDDLYERAHLDAPAGRYVMLSVSDSGVGMDAETKRRIFEPFFTTKGPGRGTGLGLSTVYGIVQQSGGSVSVYSEPERGSTFKVYFPRIDAAVEPLAPSVPASSQPGAETVLVTEDDPALLKMAVRVLQTAGYRVLQASTPEQATELAERHADNIDLLLTDVVLPGMSGRALAEGLSARSPMLKVLYMSGYTDDAVVRRGVLARDTQFIQKPFTHDSLLLKVRETLDRPS